MDWEAMLDDWEAMFEEREAMFDEREAICGCRAIIMPRRGPNWLSQVWHWPGQLGWGQSVAKSVKLNINCTVKFS